jgi:hypothetical protein
MFQRMRIILSVGLLSLVGCAKTAQVSGTVLLDGQSFQPQAEMVALTFTRDDGKLNISASVKKDGTFIVSGPNNDGLPPGKYKVGYYSDVEGDRSKKKVKDLKPEKSSLELDLQAGDQAEVVIDMGQGTMKRK